MGHETLKMLIRIYSNNRLWSEVERKAIVDEATDLHMERHRKKKIDENEEESDPSVSKRQKVVGEV